MRSGPPPFRLPLGEECFRLGRAVNPVPEAAENVSRRSLGSPGAILRRNSAAVECPLAFNPRSRSPISEMLGQSRMFHVKRISASEFDKEFEWHGYTSPRIRP